MEVTGSARARADRHDTTKARATVERYSVDVKGTFTIDNVDELSDEAMAAIQYVLQRECVRVAQIAAVALRDADVAREEAKRIAQLPADRSHVIVAAGTKEVADKNGNPFVIVQRGSVKVGPQQRLMHASKGEDR